ncbi:MAG: PilZ domain-containing protein [Pseudomonadota bacterium]
MGQGENRRIHHRWESRDTIYGYVDGARFAAKSEDLSSGGLFIETRDDVPVGALISLVFRTQMKSEEPPIFLVGRVMRRQVTPAQGIGLRWEKAVFTGPVAVLHDFLVAHLRLVDPAVVTLTGTRGEAQAVYHFNALPEAPVTAPSMEVPDTIRRGDVPLDSGPVTSRISRKSSLAPANVPSRISLDGEEEPIQVLALGVKSMFTSAPPTLLIQADIEVTVTLSVRTRTGIAEIACLCVVTRFEEGNEDDPDTLDLEIIDVREQKDHVGLLSRYVRWLHFNALTDG